MSVTLGQPEDVGELLREMVSVGESEEEGLLEEVEESLTPPAEPKNSSGRRRAPRMAAGGWLLATTHAATRRSGDYLVAGDDLVLASTPFSPCTWCTLRRCGA